LTKHQQKTVSLTAGVVIALLLYFINPFQVSESAARVLAVAGLMITWWVTEALAMPVVALMPLILFPLLKINDIKPTAAAYGNEVIFLFMGGFMLGLAIEKWELHRRIALNIVKLTGTSGNRIVLGFILATGLLSMWLSNTATTMMMFPIALSVIHVMKEGQQPQANYNNFNLCLMLAIAYASNFGGIATKVGTPPNTQFIGFFEKKYNVSIDFVDWMLLCTPLALLLMFTLYFISTKILFPNHIKADSKAGAYINGQIALLGKWKTPEKRVLFIFIATASLWIFKKLINDSQQVIKLDDNMIALMGAVALFICPAGSADKADDNLLEWEDSSKMAWGILLLFGGGIALADALEKAGLIQQLGAWLAQYAGGGIGLLFIITVLSIFISEVMSNVAQVIVFSPVVCSLAESVGMNPLILGIAMTLAASCASMLPMGTPPNAIVFASGHIKLKHMLRAGLVMNIVSIILITLFCHYILPLLM
jgi:solute carrier family 13 (sodium-dependent dicarboxylate transporter), member 2/3/5